MAVAAFVSLLNLEQSLDQFQQLHANGKIIFEKQDVYDLRSKVKFSLHLLEALPHQSMTSKMNDLTRDVKFIGVEAELLVDAEIVGQLREKSYRLHSAEMLDSIPGLHLESVIQKLESLVVEIKDELILHMQNMVKFSLRSLESHSETLNCHMEALLRELTIFGIEIELLMDAEGMDKHGDTYDGFLSFKRTLDLLIHETESCENKLMIGELGLDVYPSSSSQAVSSNLISRDKTPVVGLEEKVNWIIDELTSHERGLRVIPIVGMGGIGKTTLARHVFDRSVNKLKFYRCMWCTVTQKYDEQHILQCLLQDKTGEEKEELGTRLYQRLHGRRYLIVMDDLWSIDSWESLRLFLPDTRNGSRVIITTRMNSVADSINADKQCMMELLDDYSSWSLLQQKIFSGQHCPPELESIGKNIAKSCKGLPISLATLGGLLSKSQKNPAYWENVAQNVKKMAEYGDCINVLSLSYTYLPLHLKPCFLYFSNYNADSRMSVKDVQQR